MNTERVEKRSTDDVLLKEDFQRNKQVCCSIIFDERKSLIDFLDDWEFKSHNELPNEYVSHFR